MSRVECVFYDRERETGAVLVPVEMGRYGLSEILNLLLETQVPYDFIINGELLNSTLSEIEFVPSFIVQRDGELAFNDWISAVSCWNGSCIVGFFNGQVRIHPSGQVLDCGSVKCLCCFEFQSKVYLIVGTQEGTIKGYIQKGTEFQLNFECHGHSASVECVAFSPELGLLASGSWDKTIKLWDLSNRSKVVTKGTKRVKSTIATIQHNVDLQEHSEPVTCVKFNGSKLYSASYDHSLRIWDASTWTTERSINCEQCATCMDVKNGLIACGYADGSLRVWDTEAADGVMLKYKADHGGWVSACRFKPPANSQEKEGSIAQDMIATAGYNAQVKLWNMQAKTPVQSVKLERKLFALDWQQQIATGGEEGKLSLLSI